MQEEEVQPEMAEQTVESSHVDGGEMSGENTQVAAENGSYESAQDHNWKQANETLSKMKEENSQLRDQLYALQNQVSNFAQPQQSQEQNFFGDKEASDYAEISDLQRYVNDVVGKKEREMQSTIDMVQVQAKDPDFKKKIETYQKYLTKSQKQAIMNSSTPWSDAYEAVVNSAAYYKDQLAEASNPSAQRIANNMSKPGSVAGMGSSASLNRASQWENMSDAEIIAMGDSYAMGG